MKPYIVYKFTNKLNGKVYIGITNRGIKVRRYEHVLASTKNSKFKFHQAIKKYGIDKFDLEILTENIEDRAKANELEIKFISDYDSYKNGYNMTEGGGKSTTFIYTDEMKSKMSLSKMGIKLSDEHKTNISNSLKNKPKSKEHNEKVRLANTGFKHSDHSRLKMSEIKKLNSNGSKNPAAIIVNIFNNLGELMFTSNGDFETVCNKNGLPTKALRKSYYNNGKPIYQGKTIKKEVLTQNKEFIGWYAIKL